MRNNSLQLQTLFISNDQFSDASFHPLTQKSKSVRPLTASKVSFVTEIKESPTISHQQRKFHRLQGAMSPKISKKNYSSQNFMELTVKPQKNKKEPLEQRILERYQKETFLQTEHELLIGHVQVADQDVVNHLNLNYFGIQQESVSKQSLLESDPNLAYTLFDSLCQLDKEIIQKLFKTTAFKYSNASDMIGSPLKILQTPVQRFRLELIKTTSSILNEPMAQLIRKAGQLDKELSGFIEGLWKFFVVFLDIISQWTQDRCRDYVEEQISATKKELDDVKLLVKKLQEQLIVKLKGGQLLRAVQQKKYYTLQDKYKLIQQDMNDLNSKYEKIGSLENAQGEMLQMGIKLKEMQLTIQQVERSHQNKQKDLDKQIKGLAETFLIRHVENIPNYQKIEAELKSLQLFDSAAHIYSTSHPFCSPLIQKQMYKDENQPLVEYKQTFYQFLDKLALDKDKMNIGSSNSQLFVDLVGNSQVEYAVTQVMGQNDCAYKKMFSIIFGINGEQPIHPITLCRFIDLSKLIIGDDGFQSMEAVLLVNFDLILKQIDEDSLKQRILVRISQPLEKIYDYLLILIQELQAEDTLKWDERVLYYHENIARDGFGGQWAAYPEDSKSPLYSTDTIDDKAVWNYTFLQCSKVENLKPQNINQQPNKMGNQILIKQSFKEIRFIMLNQPKIFFKFKLPIQPPSPLKLVVDGGVIRRQSILKRNTFQVQKSPMKTSLKKIEDVIQATILTLKKRS